MEVPQPSGLSIAFKCWLQIPKLCDRKTKKPRTLLMKLEFTPHWKHIWKSSPENEGTPDWEDKGKDSICFNVYFSQNLIIKYLTDISHY